MAIYLITTGEYENYEIHSTYQGPDDQAEVFQKAIQDLDLALQEYYYFKKYNQSVPKVLPQLRDFLPATFQEIKITTAHCEFMWVS